MNDNYYFWHSVGSHAGESLNKILQRKQMEIEKYGYTLWSLANINKNRLNTWKNIIANNIPQVLCVGKATKDPYTGEGEIFWAREFSSDLNCWTKIPNDISSYHRRPKDITKPMASVFIVNNISLHINSNTSREANWFSISDGMWKYSNIPTRGLFLVKGIKNAGSMPIHAILHLKEPYIGWIR